MAILPYKKHTLITTLTTNEVSELFSNNTSPDDFFIRNSDKLFSGRVSKNNFSIRLNLSYRNSFNPSIQGKLIPQNGGARIELTFKPFLIVIIFMAVWFGGILFACIAIISEMVISGKWQGAIFIPFGMLAIGLLMMYGFFFKEYEESKGQIIKLLRSEQSKNQKS